MGKIQAQPSRPAALARRTVRTTRDVIRRTGPYMIGYVTQSGTMIVRFMASRCESEFWREKGREGFSIWLRDAATSHYLSLQRGYPFGGLEDWGVYVEVDYQWLSGFHRVATCTLSPNSIKLDFRRPLEALGREEVIDGVEATFADGCVPTDEFKQHLRAIFTGWEENLRVLSDDAKSVT